MGRFKLHCRYCDCEDLVYVVTKSLGPDDVVLDYYCCTNCLKITWV